MMQSRLFPTPFHPFLSLTTAQPELIFKPAVFSSGSNVLQRLHVLCDHQINNFAFHIEKGTF